MFLLLLVLPVTDVHALALVRAVAGTLAIAGVSTFVGFTLIIGVHALVLVHAYGFSLKGMGHQVDWPSFNMYGWI
jgi:hypothetical protein